MSPKNKNKTTQCNKNNGKKKKHPCTSGFLCGTKTAYLFAGKTILCILVRFVHGARCLLRNSVSMLRTYLFTAVIYFPPLPPKKNRSGISDAGLSRVAEGSPLLRDLDLSGCTRLTEGSVEALSSLRALESLDLSNCR